ncbi:site-specific integrase [Aurantimonas sp. C2-5-R2]|uniref:tyrosine-type recombinase/integrase n=1 Tax=Aurantimonas sp. C2-5-R2 TaxID=3113713 RepID=UPI002F948E2C
MAIRVRNWTTAKGEAKSAYVVDYYDQAGKRHIKTFSRKKDAQAFDAKTHIEVAGRLHIADADTITVSAAAELWLTSCDAAGLERSTVAQYRQHVHRHIVPLIGTHRLTEVSVPFVRAFLDKLREEGRSEAMQRNVRVSLGSVLSDAQERGLVVRNAVKEMGRDKKGRTRHSGRHRTQVQAGVDIPTPAEVKVILGGATGRVRVFLMTAVFTGMRASELRGLRWSDVDFSKSSITVRQRADAYQEIGSPKSKKGRRTIPMVSGLAKALTEWQSQCPTGDQDLVFPNGAGNIEFHVNIIRRLYAPVQIAAGVTSDDGGPKYPGLHALRHFYASWCINRKEDGGLGLPPKVVQERLGHSSIQMTLDVYGHLFDKGDTMTEMDSAADMLLTV